MIKRVGKNLSVLTAEVPAASVQLERDGYAVLRDVLTDEEVAELRAEIDATFEAYPPERNRTDRDEFRYEMVNRGAAESGGDRPRAHPRSHRAVARRRLPRDREHGVAQLPRLRRWSVALRRRTARSPPRRRRLGRSHPVSGVRDRRAHPACRTAPCRAGRRPWCPAATAPDGSRRSTGSPTPISPTTGGRPSCSPRMRATWRCSCPTCGTGARRLTAATAGTSCRSHYGRRDIAQRIRTTDQVNQLSPEAIERAQTQRQRDLVGLHDPYFYDG